MRVTGQGKWREPLWRRALCSDWPRLIRLRLAWAGTMCTGEELAVLYATPGRGVRGVCGSCRRPRLGVLEAELSAAGLPSTQPLPWMKIEQAIWNNRTMRKNVRRRTGPVQKGKERKTPRKMCDGRQWWTENTRRTEERYETPKGQEMMTRESGESERPWETALKKQERQ